MLEYHTHVPPHFVDICMGIRELLSVKGNGSPCRLLQQVQAAQKGRLARSGRSYNNHLLPGPDMGVDIGKHLIVPEGFR